MAAQVPGAGGDARRRRDADLRFLAIHCLVTLGYMAGMESLDPLPLLLMLCSSFLPALVYWSLPAWRAHQLRTPIFVLLKLAKAATLLWPLSSKFPSVPAGTAQPWPVFLLQLIFTGRAVGFLALGLGLPLPLAVDLPLHLLGTALMAAAAVPAQCVLPNAPAAAAAPTLFQLQRERFQELGALLDFPFAPAMEAEGQRAALALSDAALCTSVLLWSQVVAAFLAPLTALLAAEHRRLSAPEPGTAAGARGGERREASSWAWAWPYFLFAAEVSWCIIRTAVVKLGG